GMGFGLLAFLGAKLLPGAELLCDAVGLDKALVGADYVITGEGRMDWQTAFGKAPGVVARRANAKSILVLGIAGSLGPGHEQLYALGFREMLGIVRPDIPESEAILWAWPLLTDFTERLLGAALAKR
ncbi:MAG: glycerate kinase, partial [Dehalococcoidia bacterium]|nr:glycerate kinase [Dehalococcoidia bacterium]